MKIEQYLPFESCENCKDYVMKVDDVYLTSEYGGEKHVVIRCKKAANCKRKKECPLMKEDSNVNV